MAPAVPQQSLPTPMSPLPWPDLAAALCMTWASVGRPASGHWYPFHACGPCGVPVSDRRGHDPGRGVLARRKAAGRPIGQARPGSLARGIGQRGGCKEAYRPGLTREPSWGVGGGKGEGCRDVHGHQGSVPHTRALSMSSSDAALTCIAPVPIDREARMTPQSAYLLVDLQCGITMATVLCPVGPLHIEAHLFRLPLHPDLGDRPGDAMDGLFCHDVLPGCPVGCSGADDEDRGLSFC